MARAARSAALTCDLDPAPSGRRPRGRGQSAAHTDVLDARCGFPGSLTLGPPALPPLGATPCHAHGPRKHRAARVCHTPRGAEGGLRRCGQRRCAPSPRPAARLCLVSAAGVLGLRRRRRLRAWRASCYEAVGRKGSRRSLRQAAHGWPAVHRVRRRCHRPVSCAWAARHPSTAVAAPAARAPGRCLSKGLALATRGLWPRAARTAPGRGPPSARGAYGGPLFRRRTRCLSCKLSHTAGCSQVAGHSRPTKRQAYSGVLVVLLECVSLMRQ